MKRVVILALLIVSARIWLIAAEAETSGLKHLRNDIASGLMCRSIYSPYSWNYCWAGEAIYKAYKLSKLNAPKEKQRAAFNEMCSYLIHLNDFELSELEKIELEPGVYALTLETREEVLNGCFLYAY